MIGDPSSKTAVVPVDGRPIAREVEAIGISLETGEGVQPRVDLIWDGWNKASATERVKARADQIAAAWRDVSR